MFLMPSVCSGFWCLGDASGISAGMSISHERSGDLIGGRVGATLPAMSVKMTNISWSETGFAMV